jgi:PTH1 family peptidyl-tRNA hydrolase
MKVIFGLGNPGDKYEGTRHNAGFMFVDKLHDFFGWDTALNVSDWENNKKVQAEISKIRFSSEIRVLLVKPLTFMNKTGIAARKIVSWFNLENISNQFILAHDDLDIEMGEFKIQRGVSPKSHNGVRSVESMLEKKDFWRVRLGVDTREGDRTIPPEDYVLQKIEPENNDVFNEELMDAVKTLRSRMEF